ncbi:FAD dependent oxidoreductase [Xylariaceae sp. FL1019]|nr:FAD dependent oxidoreductase [Xylariaceae sp. FL1019]
MTDDSLFNDQGALGGRAGLPTPTSTASYWHREPSTKLIGHRTSTELPSSADIVIIGSGITGAFGAKELVDGGRRVVMLEAREACWGATGRNGGHCQPGVWNASPTIARFELETFRMIEDLVKEHGISCDWRVVGGIHAIYSPETLATAKAQVKRLQAYPDLRDKAVLIEDKDELAARHVPDALAAVFQPLAAQLWPYKLIAWILERLIHQCDAATFNLQTNTPVTHIEYRERWLVHTQRGTVEAENLLLATNGYTSHLVPGLTSLITPVRAQISALEPPLGATQLPHSYVWMKEGDYQYLIQRHQEDTHIKDSDGMAENSLLIFGGERPAAQARDYGLSRDDEVDPVVSQALRDNIHDGLNVYHGVSIPGKSNVLPALRAAYEWTGIMGYSSDDHPWVGRVPPNLFGGKHAVNSQATDAAYTGTLWMSGGYTGHGMPVAARCGVAVAQMILGFRDGVQVPREWMITDARVQSCR